MILVHVEAGKNIKNVTEELVNKKYKAILVFNL